MSGSNELSPPGFHQGHDWNCGRSDRGGDWPADHFLFDRPGPARRRKRSVDPHRQTGRYARSASRTRSRSPASRSTAGSAPPARLADLPSANRKIRKICSSSTAAARIWPAPSTGMRKRRHILCPCHDAKFGIGRRGAGWPSASSAGPFTTEFRSNGRWQSSRSSSKAG